MIETRKIRYIGRPFNSKSKIQITKPENKSSQTPVKCPRCKLDYVTSFERWKCNSCGFYHKTEETKLEYEIVWHHINGKYIPAYGPLARQDREVYSKYISICGDQKLKILGYYRWIKIIKSKS